MNLILKAIFFKAAPELLCVATSYSLKDYKSETSLSDIHSGCTVNAPASLENY